jgi:preprotein translocase subunit SecG
VYSFFLMVLILDGLFLILVVLLQSGKGTGLAAEFGGASSSTDSFLGGRQAATVLTKASWISGGVFMALALLLAILSARGRQPGSILEGQLRPPASQEAPTPLLDEERQNPLAPAQEGEGGKGEQSGEGGGSEQSPPPEGN